MNPSTAIKALDSSLSNTNRRRDVFLADFLFDALGIANSINSIDSVAYLYPGKVSDVLISTRYDNAASTGKITKYSF